MAKKEIKKVVKEKDKAPEAKSAIKPSRLNLKRG